MRFRFDMDQHWDRALQRRLAPALIAAATLFWPALVQAQSDTYFDRSHNISVLQRPRPDYDSLGVDLGSLTVFPTLAISPKYDDNIFAVDHGRQSDFISVIEPIIVGQTNWSRNSLSFEARDTSNIFISHTEESTNDYAVSGNGRLDILYASNLNAGLSYSSNTIPRTAENNITTAQKPIQYFTTSAQVGALQGFSRVRLSENFNYFRTSYQDALSEGGRPLELNLLDNDQYTGNFRADYGVTPEISLFVSGVYNQRVYVVSPLTVDRTSQGYETTVGADFDITELIRGQVQVGYLEQYYRSALFKTVSGPAVHMQVEYFLSGLTTVTAKVDRSVIDAVDPTAISFLDTQASLRVDHELLRNFLLSAKASYEYADFRGVQRNDHRPAFTASGTYLFNRHLGLTAAYSFLNEASSGLQRIGSYTVDLISLSLVLRL